MRMRSLLLASLLGGLAPEAPAYRVLEARYRDLLGKRVKEALTDEEAAELVIATAERALAAGLVIRDSNGVALVSVEEIVDALASGRGVDFETPEES